MLFGYQAAEAVTTPLEKFQRRSLFHQASTGLRQSGDFGRRKLEIVDGEILLKPLDFRCPRNRDYILLDEPPKRHLGRRFSVSLSDPHDHIVL
jgi:hypothetical protein